ncbi:MAG: hypothetical protein ACI30R_10535, partial [Sodaliphilus sp.]
KPSPTAVGVYAGFSVVAPTNFLLIHKKGSGSGFLGFKRNSCYQAGAAIAWWSNSRACAVEKMLL